MKKYQTSLCLLLFLSHMGFAQTLETIYINESVSTHFITSEPIQYVDISTEHIVGDMPVKNILRLKPVQLMESAETVKPAEPVEQGIVTIVCQKYMVQYRLLHSDVLRATKSKFISAMDGTGLLLPELTISAEEMKTLSLQLIQSAKKKALARSNDAGMKISVNGVYSSGDYYFLDVTILNRSNIIFETDQLRFHIKDKKVLKSTNVQQIEILPEFVLYHQNQIRRKYRNVLVFKKFTFPNEKIFELEISEKQISGRTMRLQLDYKDILQAEPF